MSILFLHGMKFNNLSISYSAKIEVVFVNTYLSTYEFGSIFFVLMASEKHG